VVSIKEPAPDVELNNPSRLPAALARDQQWHHGLTATAYTRKNLRQTGSGSSTLITTVWALCHGPGTQDSRAATFLQDWHGFHSGGWKWVPWAIRFQIR